MVTIKHFQIFTKLVHFFGHSFECQEVDYPGSEVEKWNRPAHNNVQLREPK